VLSLWDYFFFSYSAVNSNSTNHMSTCIYRDVCCASVVLLLMRDREEWKKHWLS